MNASGHTGAGPVRTLTGNGRSVDIGGRTLLMGIVNVTPDSFFDGGRHASAHAGVAHGLHLVEDGADVLDVGGESTRPGAAEVSVDEEINRVIPVIDKLVASTDVPISVDTTKAEVARRAIEAGASWINDISAGSLDPEILAVAGEFDVPFVAMHMRGTPRTMQTDTAYTDIVGEILDYFRGRLDEMQRVGIDREKVLLDPGIGFGKALEDNYLLLARLAQFRELGCPLLVGPSRKSFLKLAGAEDPEKRLPGTLAAVTACALSGVEVVRVHDVAEARQAVNVAERIRAATKS